MDLAYMSFDHIRTSRADKGDSKLWACLQAVGSPELAFHSGDLAFVVTLHSWNSCGGG